MVLAAASWVVVASAWCMRLPGAERTAVFQSSAAGGGVAERQPCQPFAIAVVGQGSGGMKCVKCVFGLPPSSAPLLYLCQSRAATFTVHTLPANWAVVPMQILLPWLLLPSPRSHESCWLHGLEM